ncbi:MAG TPA: hypothetical protein VGT81_15130 [Casimicrobiaceae bacterium]|nr:hypothetical protein [Casimicrobiaceae bacterium]
MARWLVKLDGERADLEEFPLRFPDGELYAVEKDGGVYLTGPEFEQLAGAEQVREHARGAAEEMSAIISLLWSAFRKPSIGNVQREDDEGGVSNWVFAEILGVRAKASVGMVVIRKDGAQETISAENKRPTAAQRLLGASRATPHLRTAVLLWAFPDRAWWLLYRIVEDIETHLNELGIATSVSEAGYCSGKERARFRHSANSAEASGLGARHAAGKWDPPKDPMSLEDATIFVKGLLEQALRDGRV